MLLMIYNICIPQALLRPSLPSTQASVPGTAGTKILARNYYVGTNKIYAETTILLLLLCRFCLPNIYLQLIFHQQSQPPLRYSLLQL